MPAILLAKQTDKSIKPTLPFTQRGIPNMTQAKLGDVIAIAKPFVGQLAYSGYAANIEAFVFAKAMNRSTATNLRQYCIPETTATVPLMLPKVVLRLKASKPASAFLSSFNAALGPIGGVKRDIGKGNLVYTITQAGHKHLKDLAAVADPVSPFVDHHATIFGAQCASFLIRWIDLFLSVQTYEYKGIVDGHSTSLKRGRAIFNIMNIDEIEKGEIGGLPTKRRKGESGQEIDATMEEDDDEEASMYVDDDGNTFNHQIPISEAVLVAKPSPYPSEFNYGPPNAVPNLPGLFFRYFPGLNIPDNSNLTELCARLVFRNIPGKGDIFDNWKIFRADIRSLNGTEEGSVIHHILYGLKMSLDAQARPFLVIADGKYHGFCLLGEYFGVVVAGTKVFPENEQDLRTSLSVVATREDSVNRLLAELRGCKYSLKSIKASEIKKENVEQCANLAFLLSEIDLSEDTEEEQEKRISDLLVMTQPAFHYTKLGPKEITEVIYELLQSATNPEYKVPMERPFYIPARGWSGIAENDYMLFASFGANAFSLRNMKGLEVEFRDPKDTDPFMVAEEGGKEKRLYTYVKPVRQCVHEWRDLLRTGSLRYDPAERGGVNRAIVHIGENKKMIYDALRSGVPLKAYKAKGKGKEVVRDDVREVDFSSDFSFSV